MTQQINGKTHYEEDVQILMAGSIAAEKSGSPYEFERICFHEAGHAVVSHHFGRVVSQIKVAEHIGGVTSHSGKTGINVPAQELAQTLDEISSDQEKIADATRTLIIGGAYPDLESLHARASAIISEHWGYVCRIARILMMLKENGAATLGEAELEGLWN